MGTINNGRPQSGAQKNFQTPSQQHRDDRRDMAKHQYADHDQETNDANFEAGKDKTGGMDFRDKKDNLEAEE